LERYAQPKYRSSTLREVARTYDRAMATWRGRRLDSIGKADVRDFLESIEGPAAANQSLKYLGRLFSWAVTTARA
jgi:hypothetical protein